MLPFSFMSGVRTLIPEKCNPLTLCFRWCFGGSGGCAATAAGDADADAADAALVVVVAVVVVVVAALEAHR